MPRRFNNIFDVSVIDTLVCMRFRIKTGNNFGISLQE